MNMRRLSLSLLLFSVGFINCEQSSTLSSEDVKDAVLCYSLRKNVKNKSFPEFEKKIQHRNKCFKIFEAALIDCQKRNNCENSIELKQTFEDWTEAEVSYQEMLERVILYKPGISPQTAMLLFDINMQLLLNNPH